jgi:pimeloyl-ACP methyl ester carboxylesterase
MLARHHLRLALVVTCLFVGTVTTAAARPTATGAEPKKQDGQQLVWTDCGGGAQCSSLKVPRDYDRPDNGTFTLAITRLPAHGTRLGALFVNFGGPGGTVVDAIQAFGGDLFGAVNDHFDIVGVDPRGVGQTSPAVDCKANQETDGIYAQPFVTPFNLDRGALTSRARAYIRQCKNLNGSTLRYISTANTARDMDQVRAAMGDAKLNYFGFSYGTFLGATYMSLFPNRYRAVVLDGPVDVSGYANKPSAGLREQSAGFERALGRFFQACAGNPGVCPFGDGDPWAAFDDLVMAAYDHPLPAGSEAPVDGDDMIAGATLATYSKFYWPLLSEALQEAAAGDGSTFRLLADAFYGSNGDGTYSPGLDLYFLITAADQAYSHGVDQYLDAGDESWGLFDHTWWNTGYPEVYYGLYDVDSNSVFRGPFKASKNAPTVLEVATTYDPATPYRGALRTAAQLGNVRLLTMRGDGHTAYGGESSCVDNSVNAYIETLALPAKGTICKQEFPVFGDAAVARARVAAHPLSAELWRAWPHGS